MSRGLVSAVCFDESRGKKTLVGLVSPCVRLYRFNIARPFIRGMIEISKCHFVAKSNTVVGTKQNSNFGSSEQIGKRQRYEPSRTSSATMTAQMLFKILGKNNCLPKSTPLIVRVSLVAVEWKNSNPARLVGEVAVPCGGNFKRMRYNICQCAQLKSAGELTKA